MNQQRKKNDNEANGDDSAKLSNMEAEIDQTRKSISADIGVIGEKLSPERLKEQAKEKMVDMKDAAVETLAEAKDAAVEKMVGAKDAAVEKMVEAKDAAVEKLTEVTGAARDKFVEAKDATVETLTETYEEVRDEVVRVGAATSSFVQRNAIPLTLLGIGAAWLIASNRKGASSAGAWRPPRSGERSLRSRNAESNLGGASSRSSSATSRVTDKAQKLAHRAGSAISEGANEAREFAQDEIHKVRGFAQDEYQKVRGFASEEIDKARDFSRHVAEERPLMLGAVAFAAGLGVGLLLPLTSKENALLGPTRDKLLEGAKGTAQEFGQVAKDAAQEFGQAAKDAAHDVKGTLSGSV